MDEKKRWYCCPNKAWYSNTVDLTVISFGFDDSEMTMEWYQLGNESVPRLQVFNDSWRALSEMRDLIAQLARYDGVNITPNQFCEILETLGFEDITPYERE